MIGIKRINVYNYHILKIVNNCSAIVYKIIKNTHIQLKIHQFRKHNINKCKSAIKAIKEKHLNINHLNN